MAARLPMSTRLRQLLYVSRSVRGLSPAEVRQIVLVSQRNNRRLDVTGCLVFTGRRFSQVLEGSVDAIVPVLQRIRLDPRHSELHMVIDRELTRRMWPDWSMGYVYSLDLADELDAMSRGEHEANDDLLHDFMRRMRADSGMGTPTG